MRRALLCTLLLFRSFSGSAQDISPVFFGKQPNQVTAADVERGTAVTGPLAASRFLQLSDPGAKLLAFTIAFEAATGRDLIGPFPVAVGPDGAVPVRIVALLRQAAAAHGKVFVDEIKVRRPGDAQPRNAKPALLTLR